MKKLTKKDLELAVNRQKNKFYPAVSYTSLFNGNLTGIFTTPNNIRLIPLGSHITKDSGDIRKKNWRDTIPSYLKSKTLSHDMGRYSRNCSYTRYEYTRLVQSFGVVIKGHLFAKIDGTGKIIHLRPWRGWNWKVDKNGIYFSLVRKGRRELNYHPTASDLLECKRPSEFATKAKQNYKFQRENEISQTKEMIIIKSAIKEKVYICWNDGRQAGNCAAGLSNFCGQNGLQNTNHYITSKVVKLISQVPTEAKRIKAVIYKAYQRHKQELRQGFSDLKYHLEQN
jgi:hypothetical protein